MEFFVYHDTLSILHLSDFKYKAELAEIRRDGKTVIVKLKLIKSIMTCSECKSRNLRFKGYYYKLIKYSILTSEPLVIRFHHRRYNYLVCKKSFHERNPFTQAVQLYQVSIQTVINVFDEAVNPVRLEYHEL
jgi:transposase